MVAQFFQQLTLAYISSYGESSTNKVSTEISSQIGTKLRDWAVGQAGAGCYSRAALSSNDSKTRYRVTRHFKGLELLRQPG